MTVAKVTRQARLTGESEFASCCMNVENFKRRQALPLRPDRSDARFFDRILSVRRLRELVFITKAAARDR